MNNGFKSGLLIIGISVLGIAFFGIAGRDIPVFFPRFLIVGILITALGFFTRNRGGSEDEEDTGRRLR